MDVKCERCNTEYEFDDALVSGRGTTVKCTNCGHKFKIRRSDGDFSEDFWNVTTGDGRTLVFTSLRELQRAIQGYLVERNDRLSRGGLPPKAIGQIPELAPFFDQREAASAQKKTGTAGAGKAVRTQDGLGPAAEQAREASHAGLPPVRPRQPTKPEFPAPPADSTPNLGKTTLIGTGPATEEEALSVAPGRGVPVSVPPPTEREAPRFDALVAKTKTEPPPPPAPPPAPKPVAAPATPPPVPVRARESVNTVPIQRPTPPPPPPPKVPPAGARTAVGAPPPLPTAVERRRPDSDPQVRPSDPGPPARPSEPGPAGPAVTPPPAPARASYHTPAAPLPAESSSPLPPPMRTRSLLAEIEEDRDRGRGPSASIPDGPPSRRRSVGGFIVAAVVVGCLLMLGAVWAQKNLGITLGTKPPAPAPTVDPRVAGYLGVGEKALADGNLDLAKEQLDKASALAEKEPHVLLGLARLAAMRADVLWLKSRLLSADAADDHRITRDGLSELAAGARKAADDALAVAPDDLGAIRAKIDVLRISGDRDGARALVPKITPTASQPESAYVLAALDLAEVEPLWPTVLDRLKIASSAESGPGRARAALVFALARSGDVTASKAELDRLSAMTRPHPLLPLLRAFAERAKPKTMLDGGVADAAVALDTRADAGKAGVALHGGGPAPAGLPGDARELVSQGERARAKGDYDKARTLFSAALDRNANDSEALAGLAAISYAQRDLSGARASYKKVLSINPNYMPALVGLADVEWESGDKGAATRMYKDIVDRYPEGAYPARVKQRSEGGG